MLPSCNWLLSLIFDSGTQVYFTSITLNWTDGAQAGYEWHVPGNLR